VPTGILRQPWLRFSRAFSSVVRQMPGYNSPRQGTGRTLPTLWIVLFYVLFVCKCVLYYRHWVATQLQLNISYHIIYHIVSYHIYHILSYHISHLIIPYISYRISYIYHTIYHILSYIYIISYRIISYISYHITSYHISNSSSRPSCSKKYSFHST
jgi:hypothetical protein